MLNARILHDLGGSIGVVDNSLSLVGTSTKEISRKAKLLAIEESSNLVKKLNIFRAAYSSADLSNDKSASVIFLVKLLQDFSSINQNIKLNLNFEDGMICLGSELMKISLCLVMIASEKIQHSGEIDFSCGGSEDQIFLKINSCANEKVKLCSNLEILNEGKNPKIDQVNLRNCRECYVNKLCESIGYGVSVSANAKSLEYSLFKLIK